MITSRRNPQILTLASLATRKGRRETGCTLAEGPHLVRDALQVPSLLQEIVLAEDASPECQQLAEAARAGGVPILCVNRPCYEKLSALRSPEGIAAVIRFPEVDAPTLLARETRLLFLVGVQDPGNLGALVRVAEAAGVQGCLCVGGAEPDHPKALRASMGSLLRLPCPCAPTEEDALRWLQDACVRLIASALTPDAIPFMDADYASPVAIALGGEGAGLPDRVLRRAAQTVHIPMAGRIESLNVAVAAGILLYEAKRQWEAPA